MARPLRINMAGAWYHVMSRGNGGDSLFRSAVDRHRFLGWLAEMPERFSLEVHAFVLMDNHYQLLIRTREDNLSHAIRWLHTCHAGRFNWAHHRRGPVFQGRFKAMLILDDGSLDAVGRHLHLSPVRIHGLGLTKEDQRRARVTRCENPEKELVSRRMATLRNHPWSSWRVYSGVDPQVPWLCRERIQGGCGGRTLKEQRRALTAFTEGPIRQGVLESPWESLVAGFILGDERKAQQVLKQVRGDSKGPVTVHRGVGIGMTRPTWEAMVSAAEKIHGRRWAEMMEKHGDWGRNGLLAVATRHLGWRLAEVVQRLPGLAYSAAAQGIRRFWQLAPHRPQMQAFEKALVAKCSKVQV